ncbi:hypothetical protein FACS189460_0830 [Deltaproteobacteria bacterium]|nr:hypothetical protein FACS189460_0830 [Deltaproteobacteria bacterium]
MNDNGQQSYTTDQLAEMEKNGTLPDYVPDGLAKINHQQVDVVTFDAKGNIVNCAQLKALSETTSIQYLLQDKYLTEPGAPDYLEVPSNTFDRTEDTLKKLASGNDAEMAEKAKIALTKLKKSDVSMSESKSPYTSIAVQTTADVAKRVGERSGKLLLSELATISIGGAMWEIKDEFSNPGSITIPERLERLIKTIWTKLAAASTLTLKKELALEILHLITGAVANVFKSAKNLLSVTMQSIGSVWDAIWNYLTGKLSSFSELVTIILKTLTSIGIASFAFILETELIGVGIPSLLAGILAAAAAAMAIVLANKSIDVIVLTLVASFSRAEAAKLRAEQVAAKSQEILPKIIAQRDELEAFIDTHYAKREQLFQKSFLCLNVPENIETNLSVLEKINKAFGKSLGYSNFGEFDDLMLSPEPFKI